MFKNMLKMISVFSLMLISSILMSFSNNKFDQITISGKSIEYIPLNKIRSNYKNPVECFFDDDPKREAFRIGTIRAKGASYSPILSIFYSAQKMAYDKGADFVKLEVANKYSTEIKKDTVEIINGEKIFTYNYPWGEFSIWVYKPSISGIYFNENHVVTGFHAKSNAQAIGIRLGDTLIEIDHINIGDDLLIEHLNKIKPRDKNTYTVLRDGKMYDFTIIALPNK